MPCLFANCEPAAVNCPSEGIGLLGGDHATPHRTRTASNEIKGLLSTVSTVACSPHLAKGETEGVELKVAEAQPGADATPVAPTPPSDRLPLLAALYVVGTTVVLAGAMCVRNRF